MGQAREVMDRYTEAITRSDLAALTDCFAEDAVAYTPDHGEIRGREGILAYFREMTDAIPTAEFSPEYKYEVDDTAIDEGFFTGRNTGPLTLPTGETLPATQRDVRLRGCDLATVRDGRIVSYRLYFDQMEFLEQVGLLPDEA